MADALRLIDAAIEQASEVLFCGWCKGPLTGREETLEFCNRQCQQLWNASPRWSYGEMSDGQRGIQMAFPDPDDFSVRYSEVPPPSRQQAARLLKAWERFSSNARIAHVDTGRRPDAVIAQLRAYIASLPPEPEVQVNMSTQVMGRYRARVTVAPAYHESYGSSDDVWLTESQVIDWQPDELAAHNFSTWLSTWWRDRINRHSQ